MKITSSPMLLDFYKSWYNQENPKYRTAGLCHGIWVFVSEMNPSASFGTQRVICRILQNEMKEQFTRVGITNHSYPFNNPTRYSSDGEADYRKEMRNKASHRNADRLAWVKSRLDDGVDDNEKIIEEANILYQSSEDTYTWDSHSSLKPKGGE